MNDNRRTKRQLIRELKLLRGRATRLENAAKRSRHTKRALRKNEALLRALVDNLPIDLWVRDDAGRCILENRIAIEQWGSQLGKLTDEAQIGKENVTQWRENNKRAARGEVVRTEAEYTYNNTKRYYLTVVAPIRENREISGSVGFNIDITDRKKAEIALEKREQQLKEAQSAASLGNWEWDAIADTATCSDELYRLFGRDPKLFKFSVNAFLESPHPDDREMVAGFVRQLFQTRQPTDFDYRIITPAGEVRWLYSRTAATVEDSGRLIRLHGTVQDITQRKRDEESLLLLAHAIRSIGECVSVTDVENRILFVNDAFLSTYGYTPNELIGKPIGIVRSPRTELVTDDVLLATIQGGWQGELMNQKKDGTVFPITLSTSSVRNDEGRLLGLVGIAADISERKRAEASLEMEHTLLRTTIENIPDEICLKDLNSRYLMANDAARRALGAKSMEEMFGKSDVDYVRADLAASHLAEEKAMLESGEGLYNLERIRYDQKTGEIQKCDISTKVPVKNQSGEIIGLLVVNRDITERKLVEEALKESEDRYRQLVEGSPFAIAVECEGRFVYVNPAVAQLVGAENAQELVGKSLLEVIQPESRERVMVRLQKLMEGKGVPLIEEKLMKLDGTPIYAEVASMPTTYMDKPAAQVIVRDITARKLAEEALRESEEKYRTLVETADDAIILTDPEGKFLFRNSAYFTSLGFEVGEDIPRDGYSLVHPDDLPRLKNHLAKLFERDSLPIEYRVRHKKGHWIYRLAKSTVIYDEAGKPKSILTIIHDITERKRAEENLRVSEAKFRALFDRAGYAMGMAKGDTQILVNEAYRDLFGYRDVSEVIGNSLLNDIAPEERTRLREYARRRSENESAPCLYETRGIRRDGSFFDMDVRISTYEFGGDTYTIGIMSDITERKRAEVSLQTTSKHLRELAKHLQSVREEEKKRLSQEFHDQLGQTLTALKMDLAMLQRRVADTSRELSRPDLQAEMLAMQHMLDQAIGSIREIMSELRPELLDQLGILPALEGEAERFERRSGIACEFSSSVAPLEFDAERSIALFRIFQEALTNVSRHAQATHVRTTVRVDEGHLLLEIRDNGVGISPTVENKSTSFGLIGMRERALLLGGTLEIRSEKGEGTTVFLRVPLATEELKGGSGT